MTLSRFLVFSTNNDRDSQRGALQACRTWTEGCKLRHCFFELTYRKHIIDLQTDQKSFEC